MLLANSPFLNTDVYGLSPISVIFKQMAKMGLKKGIKEYIESRIEKEIIGLLQKKAYRKITKKISKEAFEILDMLDSEWWEIVIECIPVAGDVYGTGKLSIQLQKINQNLEKLENKALQISQIAKRGMKRVDDKYLKSRVGDVHAYKEKFLIDEKVGYESISHFDIYISGDVLLLVRKATGEIIGID